MNAPLRFVLLNGSARRGKLRGDIGFVELIAPISHQRIQVYVRSEFSWNIYIGMDRFPGALRNTGVAIEMASRGFGARLILLSPFSSLVDLAGIHVPWFPARYLLHNRYDNADKAPGVELPVLIVHGEDDPLVPAEMGRRLAQRFPHAEFVALPDVAHGAMIDRHASTVLRVAQRWLSATAGR